MAALLGAIGIYGQIAQRIIEQAIYDIRGGRGGSSGGPLDRPECGCRGDK